MYKRFTLFQGILITSLVLCVLVSGCAYEANSQSSAISRQVKSSVPIVETPTPKVENTAECPTFKFKSGQETERMMLRDPNVLEPAYASNNWDYPMRTYLEDATGKWAYSFRDFELAKKGTAVWQNINYYYYPYTANRQLIAEDGTILKKIYVKGEVIFEGTSEITETSIAPFGNAAPTMRIPYLDARIVKTTCTETTSPYY